MYLGKVPLPTSHDRGTLQLQPLLDRWDPNAFRPQERVKARGLLCRRIVQLSDGKNPQANPQQDD